MHRRTGCDLRLQRKFMPRLRYPDSMGEFESVVDAYGEGHAILRQVQVYGTRQTRQHERAGKCRVLFPRRSVGYRWSLADHPAPRDSSESTHADEQPADSSSSSPEDEGGDVRDRHHPRVGSLSRGDHNVAAGKQSQLPYRSPPVDTAMPAPRMRSVFPAAWRITT